jgi:CelD/BcsL family acetyltransferase involved in cellulose biosynthesis
MMRMQVRSPRVLAVRSGRDLVGLVPAFAWGVAPRRTLSLLGAGVSDHLDALVAPGFERAMLESVTTWLGDARGEWDACVFDEIGPRAALRGLLPPAGASRVNRAQSVCPVLVGAEGATQLEGVVPQSMPAKLRKACHRAGLLGKVTFRRVDHGDFSTALHTLFALHGKRWKSRGQPGVLADPRIIEFHEDVSREFARRRSLRLYVLWIGDQRAAVVYGFREHCRLHLYLQGIELALERVSPGMIALGHVVADALAEGIREIDFLRGGEPYKYQWGARDEANVQIRICV